MSDRAPAIEYTWWPKQWVGAALISEISVLFSEHYGYWSADRGDKRGRVKLSPAQIARLFTADSSVVAVARSGGELVGYAIALQLKDEKWGVVSWVTQLVVHENFRNLGVAKQLLFSIWSVSDHYAWGSSVRIPSLSERSRKPRAGDAILCALNEIGRGLSKEPNELLRFHAGSIMETTGNAPE